MYAVMALCGKIYLPNFKKAAAGVQAILRFGIRNLTGCDGITDERNL
jgi:hypothetical protein